MKKMKFAFVLMSAVALLGTSNAWAKPDKQRLPTFDNDYCGPSCSWRLSDDGKTLIIKGSDDPDNPGKVYGHPIPWFNDLTGYPVVEYAPLSSSMNVEGITNLKFEGYIDQIGGSFTYGGVFEGFKSLENIIIPDNVERIDEYAFEGSGLKEGGVFCYSAQIGNGICSKEKFNGIEPWPYEITEDGTYYYNPDGQLVRAVDKDGHEIDISESSSSEETHLSEPTHVARRIYTVEEATEAVSGKGKNTFSIRYR